eukprot:365870-Rhodomonas_salina.2
MLFGTRGVQLCPPCPCTTSNRCGAEHPKCPGRLVAGTICLKQTFGDAIYNLYVLGSGPHFGDFQYPGRNSYQAAFRHPPPFRQNWQKDLDLPPFESSGICGNQQSLNAEEFRCAQ